ncbi:hypothetical protein [Chlamydia avium]|uniref:Macro domain protein n=1 Tax=Chlamydia avium 10DC88 TaxID=1229831 RepID=W8JZ96_9CHLA|nr:hypothetical protein [Chlamydia avium]AHK63012.1 Uncharacterized protein M832_01430 [Chlamydia avium 10DC88]
MRPIINFVTAPFLDHHEETSSTSHEHVCIYNNIISLIFTGILMLLTATVSWICGFSLAVILSYVVFGVVLLSIGCAWLIFYCKYISKTRISIEPHHSQLPSPDPIATSPIPEQMLLIPKLSDLSEQHVSYMLNTHFHYVSSEPKGLIKSTTRLVTLTNKLTGKQVNFFRGHPAEDSSIRVPRSAILLLTNTSKEYGLAIGRTLAVTALIDKSCWIEITGDPHQPFPPGSIVIGPWMRSGGTPPASHLIIMNPLNLECLVDLRGERRAITFRDFCQQEAFTQYINMYRQCFFLCQQEGITSLQIECLGLTELATSQEEYNKWEALCQLALLETVRLLEPTHPLTCVTINHQKCLPFFKGLQNAFN